MASRAKLSVNPRAEESRSRILDSAEGLFAHRGFDSVTLRDIAAPLGLRHASLYYHFPAGKEELFAEVMERNIRRHGAGLAAAIEAGGTRLRGKLRGAAGWFLSQAPIDLIRMAESDLKALDPKAARKLMELVYELILGRLQRTIEDSRASGEVGPCDAGLLAGGILGMVESLHSVPVAIVGRERYAMGCELIDVILKGIDYEEDRDAGG
jgi:TetR/AcrR family transcriptional regulator, cholesterol catabolism regulator